MTKINIYGIDYSLEEIDGKILDSIRENDGILGSHLGDQGKIYIRDSLKNDIKRRTIIHEIVHAICFSQGYSSCINGDEIEEFLCDFIAAQFDYISKLLSEIL